MNHSLLTKQFETLFGIAPEVVASAPGRLEVLGNHTDYNAGLTLSCAVNFRCDAAIARSQDASAKLASTAYDNQLINVAIDRPVVPEGHWSRYVLGLVDALQRRGHTIPGFAMLIDSQVPRSAGVSSSAALEMAALTGLASLMRLELSPDELARIGQEAESRAVGAQTGLLDQLTSLMGQRDHLLKIDFRSLDTRAIPAPSGWCFVAADSGVKHDLTLEYNARRACCEEAARVMGVGSLREASHQLLDSMRARLSAEAYGCALHVIGENERVLEAERCLSNNDIEGFGKLLSLSHESSRCNFKNSCDELDAMVAFAEADARCLGARLSGGGFGGISIHLVSKDDAAAYRSDLAQAMKAIHRGTSWSAVCDVSDGAAVEAAGGC